jgi:hypothetical protein
MIHTKRCFQVVDVDEDTLITKLHESIWCGCTGFRCQGYLWLNDAFSGDGAQEYAVIRESDHIQVESITVSWCTREQLTDYVKSINAGQAERMGIYNDLHIETPEQHGRCYCCA